jgi:hypothetical protein
MQTGSNTLRFAGDVTFDKIELKSLNGQFANIVNQVVSIEVYEDLFSPFMTISIVLKESVDYINLFPFVGEEYIELRIVTPGTEKAIEGKFYIYKITDRLMVKDREAAYTIKAISEEYLTDVNRKISKSFSGSISESAYRLTQSDGLNTKKKVIVEKTSNNIMFTAPYWTPTKCINNLASAAINQNKSPSYLFFENRDGFNFRSIDEMLKDNTYHKFVNDNYSRSTLGESLTSTRDPQEDYKRILEIDIPILTDYMEEIQTGRLKSRLVTHDITTKQYSVKDYSVKKDTESPSTLLNPYPGYSKYAMTNSISTLVVMPKYFGNFTKYGDVTNSKSIQKRMSFFQNLSKFKVTIQVIGRTDYTVGQIVELDIPKVTQITREDEDPRDPILSGRYIVSAISHIINKENHTCNIELIKNSVLSNLSKD